MNFIKKIYNKFCLKLYAVGMSQYRIQLEQKMYARAKVGLGTKFYNGADIVNLHGSIEKISLGLNCHIYGLLLVYVHSGELEIGDHCSLGEGSRIVCGKKIRIGNRVMIAHNVNILDNNSHPIDAKLRHDDYINSYSFGPQQFDLQAKPIIIEDDVWIGFNSIILKGVTIGRGAIIGAGSVVTKDVSPWTVNVGNPLRCIKKLEPINF